MAGHCQWEARLTRPAGRSPQLRPGLDERPASPVQGYLEALLGRLAAEPSGGEVAAYIPELARADPSRLGLAVATPRGDVHEAGDTGAPFTIQSISKPLLYGLALEDQGLERVSARVGVEPTGEAFNSIRLDEVTGSPLNPMVNAGAIAVTGLLRGAGPDERLGRILDLMSRYAGRPLEADEDVYRSERDTGHRNRAIAHLLRNFGVIEGDPEAVLDLYFRQCSVLVTARDLAVIGATLANKGVNPLTGVRALAEGHVPRVLSVMATCGMYDFAGQWIFDVGLPAKSGVSGGILAVLPGQLGIGTFSPPLDGYGNSVRGVRACQELSRRLALHLFDPPRPGEAALRRSWSGAQAGSRRWRPERTRAVLHEQGELLRVYELQGDLVFSAAAEVAALVLRSAPASGYVVLDLSRVSSTNDPAAAILADLRASLEGAGITLIVVGAADPALAGPDAPADLDRALERCEDRLLDRAGALEDEGFVPLADGEISRGLTAEELGELEAAVVVAEYAAGGVLAREGEDSQDLIVIARGRIAITGRTRDGGELRLAAVSGGTVLGEQAFIDGRPRSASAVAETPVLVYRLGRAAFDALADDGTVRTRTKILINIAVSTSDRLRRATAELTALR